MVSRPSWHALVSAATLICAQQAEAQVFVDSPAYIPQGAPFNNSQTEQTDFADVDLDGDWDLAIADGGDLGSDQNRLWVNQGFLQGGAIGFFADETAARAPGFSDPSRDLEFVDFDSDGDPDIHVTNTSTLVNMGGRWWTNQGGLQAGGAGFFADETVTRWVGLGGAGSSVPPSAVLGSGGYVTWGQDQDFADVDADGDLDLVATGVGGTFSGNEPTRIFLNDGLGYFSEFNPSGFQLSSTTIANGDPALWAEGLQQHDTNDTLGAFADVAALVQEVVLGDVDGDLDVDVLLVDRQGTPRLFRNRLTETGSLAFRDSTGTTWPQGWGNGSLKLDSDFGDLDGDSDLDLFCVNWQQTYNDLTLRGQGDGSFAEPVGVPTSFPDDDASDLLDHDADGDLDVVVVGLTGGKLFANNSGGGGLLFSFAINAIQGGLTNGALDVDAADVDADGDSDALRAGHSTDHLLLNVLNASDTYAPRLAHLEQPADHASGNDTPIRVQVYDNAGADTTGWQPSELSYSVDSGPFQSVPMAYMGGQVFGGAIPASAVGNVRYFASSTDEHGNVGESAWKSIDTSGGCSGQVATYCMPKLNTDGCLPRIEFTGAPKVGGLTSFVIRGTGVLANANGLLIYSKSGPSSAPFNGGTLCVGAGLLRTSGQNSGGAGPCGGALQFDFNAYVTLGIDPGLVPGQKVWAQFWYRDVASQGGTGLTDGVAFTLCP